MLPAVNISEDDKSYQVEVAAPGFPREDFKHKVYDAILTISAESKHESKEGGNCREYSRREDRYSSFTRSFRLPDNTKDNSVHAKFQNGFLKITIPKRAQQVKASKEIKVE